jgi:hypothetical protein
MDARSALRRRSARTAVRPLGTRVSPNGARTARAGWRARGDEAMISALR